MLSELNNERRNLVSDLKLQAASRALREAADQLDDRMMPLKGSHEEYVARNREEDLRQIGMLVTKLVRKGQIRADEKLEEIRRDLERRIEQA